MHVRNLILLTTLVILWSCYLVHCGVDLAADNDDGISNQVSARKKSERQAGLQALIPVTLILMLLSLPLLPLMVGGNLALSALRPGMQLLTGIRPQAGGLAGLSAGGGLRPLRPLRPFRPLLGNVAAAAATGSATGGAGAGGSFIYRRSFGKGPGKLSQLLTRMEEAIERYDLMNSACQRLMMCEFHKRNVGPTFGSITDALIDLFGVESRLEKSSFATRTKGALQEFLRAARRGMNQKDCTAIYGSCLKSTRLSDRTNKL